MIFANRIKIVMKSYSLFCDVDNLDLTDLRFNESDASLVAATIRQVCSKHIAIDIVPDNRPPNCNYGEWSENGWE
jgi:hypothetical protein